MNEFRNRAMNEKALRPERVKNYIYLCYSEYRINRTILVLNKYNKHSNKWTECDPLLMKGVIKNVDIVFDKKKLYVIGGVEKDSERCSVKI